MRTARDESKREPSFTFHRAHRVRFVDVVELQSLEARLDALDDVLS
jgi:hypothetical protein